MRHYFRYFVLLVVCLSAAGLSAQDALTPGTYYIQNVATGQFITAGAGYGYRGVFNTHGIDFKITGSGSSYLLTSDLNQVGRVLKPTDGYLDGTAGSEFNWTIEKQDDGTYTMYAPSQSKYYGYDPDYSSPWVIRFRSSDDGTNTRWRFWTKESLAATLEEANANNPVDATFFITAPNIVRGDHRILTDKCWGPDVTAIGGNKDSGSYLQNSCNAEQYNKATWNVTQTVTGIPNGVYSLSVQAFFRYGSTSTGSVTAYLNGTEEKLYHLYAGSQSMDLMSVYSQAQTTQSTGFNRSTDAGYVPDNQAQAAQCFTDGYYVNTLENIVVTDNTLTLGIRKDNKTVPNDWVCFDYFTLTYYGIDVTALVESYETLLATAKDLQDDPMEASVKTALNEAVNAAETDVNTSSQEWLETIISTLSTAVANAQASNALYTGDILAAVNAMKAQSASDDVKTALQTKYENGEFATAADVYST